MRHEEYTLCISHALVYWPILPWPQKNGFGKILLRNDSISVPLLPLPINHILLTVLTPLSTTGLFPWAPTFVKTLRGWRADVWHMEREGPLAQSLLALHIRTYIHCAISIITQCGFIIIKTYKWPYYMRTKSRIAPSFKWSKANCSRKGKKRGKNKSGHINLLLFGGKHSDTTILIAECNIVTGCHKHIHILHNILLKE